MCFVAVVDVISIVNCVLIFVAVHNGFSNGQWSLIGTTQLYWCCFVVVVVVVVKIVVVVLIFVVVHIGFSNGQ